MSYQKLVRDNIPEIIRDTGQQPVTRSLDDDEYVQELLKKLEEETAELKADLSLEELADVQEVVLALADRLGSREVLEQTRQAKAEVRGSFTKKLFLERVDPADPSSGPTA